MFKETIRIPLTPVPASRPRIPRWGKPYFSGRYKVWRDEAYEVVPEYTGEPADFPVIATVQFCIPRARTSKLVLPQGDGDNYEKAVYDLLQKKKYLSDDKWIAEASWRKEFLPYGAEGYCHIELEEHDGYRRDRTEEC